jgi:hypothetical protein
MDMNIYPFMYPKCINAFTRVFYGFSSSYRVDGRFVKSASKAGWVPSSYLEVIANAELTVLPEGAVALSPILEEDQPVYSVINKAGPIPPPEEFASPLQLPFQPRPVTSDPLSAISFADGSVHSSREDAPHVASSVTVPSKEVLLEFPSCAGVYQNVSHVQMQETGAVRTLSIKGFQASVVESSTDDVDESDDWYHSDEDELEDPVLIEKLLRKPSDLARVASLGDDGVQIGGSGESKSSLRTALSADKPRPVTMRLEDVHVPLQPNVDIEPHGVSLPFVTDQTTAYFDDVTEASVPSQLMNVALTLPVAGLSSREKISPIPVFHDAEQRVDPEDTVLMSTPRVSSFTPVMEHEYEIPPEPASTSTSIVKQPSPRGPLPDIPHPLNEVTTSPNYATIINLEHGGTTNHIHAATTDQYDTKSLASSSQDTILYIAIFDYDGVGEERDLCFSAGDTVLVSVKGDNGWWAGSCGVRAGWFPASYVRPLNPYSQLMEPDLSQDADAEAIYEAISSQFSEYGMPELDDSDDEWGDEDMYEIPNPVNLDPNADSSQPYDPYKDPACYYTGVFFCFLLIAVRAGAPLS